MNKHEFDKFADEYQQLHSKNIKLSGETPEFFSEYKIIDLKKLTKQYGLPESPTILDFGCGVGSSIGMMVKHFPAADIHGIDVSEKSIAIARQRFGNVAQIQAYDGEKLPYDDQSFDIVFAACVFHHIPQDSYQAIFQEIRRVLKEQGIFVIFEHNPLNPLTLHAVNTCPFDENAVLIRSGKLKAMLKEKVFAHVKYTYRIFFPGALARFRPLERYLTWVPLGAQYYIVSYGYK